eukprot:7678969-Alexandrium_andersonii.AAC.1
MPQSAPIGSSWDRCCMGCNDLNMHPDRNVAKRFRTIKDNTRVCHRPDHEQELRRTTLANDAGRRFPEANLCVYSA